MAESEQSKVSFGGVEIEGEGPGFLKTPHMSSTSFLSTATKEERKKAFSDPEPDPHLKAVKYLEQHHIVELFQSLTEKLLLSRSDDPIKFLIEEVERRMHKEEEDADAADAAQADRISKILAGADEDGGASASFDGK